MRVSRSPTHFVCVRATSPAVASAVGHFHERLLALEAAFQHALVSAAEAHITLCVLTLPEANAVTAAAAALQSVRWRTLTPRLTGKLCSFGSRVLYLELAQDDLECESLRGLAASVVAALRAAGVSVIDEERGFQPHVTVAKARRPWGVGQRCMAHPAHTVLLTRSRQVSRALRAPSAARRLLQGGLPLPGALGAVEPVLLLFPSVLLCDMRSARSDCGFYEVVASCSLEEQ
jgi:2'-5' RNA ligase